jgi:hypothetical protein
MRENWLHVGTDIVCRTVYYLGLPPVIDPDQLFNRDIYKETFILGKILNFSLERFCLTSYFKSNSVSESPDSNSNDQGRCVGGGGCCRRAGGVGGAAVRVLVMAVETSFHLGNKRPNIFSCFTSL